MDVNKCQRIPKGQSKKDNPEKLAKRRKKTKKNMRYYTTLYLDKNDYIQYDTQTQMTIQHYTQMQMEPRFCYVSTCHGHITHTLLTNNDILP